jgi:disease resistance protein RPS2
LHGLKVLDLSRTNIEKLPDSVSDLMSLTALLLKRCENLWEVPSLKKLRALKRSLFYYTYKDASRHGISIQLEVS